MLSRLRMLEHRWWRHLLLLKYLILWCHWSTAATDQATPAGDCGGGECGGTNLISAPTEVPNITDGTSTNPTTSSHPTSSVDLERPDTR